MSLNNIISKRDQAQNSQGNPLSAGYVYLYEPGTTNYITSYMDSGLVTANAQPVRLSGSGRASVWITRDCDLRITDRNGNLIISEDNVNPDALGTEESGGLVPNGSFETDADADTVPDGWTLNSETGSTNAIDTSESTDGGQSFRFTSTGSGGGDLTTTDFFPVNGTDDLRVNFDLRSTDATVRNIARVEWYDVSQVSISNSDVYDSTSNPTTYTSQQLLATPPATARFAKLKLIGVDPSVSKSASTYFDKVSVFYPAIVAGVFDNITIQNNEIISTNTNGNIKLDPNGVGIIDLFGPVVVSGTFNSLGIDDDATAIRLKLADTAMTLGGAMGFNILNFASDVFLGISGDTTASTGGNILLYGDSDAAAPGDFYLRSAANVVISWDESAGILKFATGIGSKTDALTIDASQDTALVGRAAIARDIRMLERADHYSTPAATFGIFWVKNDAPNVPMFTDDAGTDHSLIPESGTFTPVVQDASASDAEGQTYNIQQGNYQKIGDRVYFDLWVGLTSKGTLSGSIRIAGLPYSAGNNKDSAVCVGQAVNLSITAGESVTGYVIESNDYIRVLLWDATSGTSDLSSTEINDTTAIQVSGHYSV